MRTGISATMSRRQVMSAAIALGATLGLGVAPTIAQDATPAGERTVETLHGSVTVPANPQRLISLNFPITVALLELGITPIGRTTYLPHFPEGHVSGDGIALIDDAAGDLDLEKIVSLKPDLIIGDDWLDPERQTTPYEELTAIAPTLIFEWKMAGGNWDVEAAGTAEAIGKTAELDAQRDAYLQLAADVQAEHADTLAAFTWDVISGGSGNWFLYSATSSHGKVAATAGVTFNAAADQTDGFLQCSYEQFDLLKDTDAILMSADSAELMDVATFASLPAVQAGRVFTTEFFFPSSYGLSAALLADVVKGLDALGGSRNVTDAGAVTSLTAPRR